MAEDSPAFYDRGASGAAGELIAAAHFMRQGFHVYRSESQSAPFDLVIYRDGQCQRVEVKVATVTMNIASGCRAISFAMPRNEEWDLLAIVLDHDKVFVWGRDHTLPWMRDRVREYALTLPERDHWKRDYTRGGACYHEGH